MFTRSVEQLVHTVGISRPTARVVFPPGLVDGAVRRRVDEPAHLWLRRCADAFGGIDHVTLEENLAVFLIVHVRASKITYANLQALWAEVPMTAFVRGDGTQEHRYLRLDHDLKALGPMLKEPQPHVHIEADGEPRFPVLAPDGDFVGWFLDFVYRNFFYDHWIAWAEAAWDDWCRQRVRPNQWPRLVQAFGQSQAGVIQADPGLRDDVAQLKQCLLAARRRLFPFAVDTDHAELFGHHAA